MNVCIAYIHSFAWGANTCADRACVCVCVYVLAKAIEGHDGQRVRESEGAQPAWPRATQCMFIVRQCNLSALHPRGHFILSFFLSCFNADFIFCPIFAQIPFFPLPCAVRLRPLFCALLHVRTHVRYTVHIAVLPRPTALNINSHYYYNNNYYFF